MNQPHAVTGMILSAMPIGEYDKRLVLLTKERGKISAFVKSARKTGSHLMGATNPFTFGTFEMYEGRSSNTITKADISNYFPELATDYMSAYYGFYFMEIAEYYTRENNDERQMLGLLYQTMRALVSGKVRRELVRYIYELKTLAINGEAPQVAACVSCGDKDRKMLFSGRNHGIICEACKELAPDGLSAGKATVYTMQYIISSPVKNLYTFTVSDEVLGELGRIMKQYMGMQADREFKSLKILETCR